MVSIMADKKLLDMANKVANEFNSEKDFEEFTKAQRQPHLTYRVHQSPAPPCRLQTSCSCSLNPCWVSER